MENYCQCFMSKLITCGHHNRAKGWFSWKIDTKLCISLSTAVDTACFFWQCMRSGALLQSATPFSVWDHVWSQRGSRLPGGNHRQFLGGEWTAHDGLNFPGSWHRWVKFHWVSFSLEKNRRRIGALLLSGRRINSSLNLWKQTQRCDHGRKTVIWFYLSRWLCVQECVWTPACVTESADAP